MIAIVLKVWVIYVVFQLFFRITEWGKTLELSLSKKGITIRMLHMSIETNYFNSIIYNLFNQANGCRRKLVYQYFDCGIVAMGIGQLIALVALLSSVIFYLNHLFTIIIPHTSLSYADSRRDLSSPVGVSSALVDGGNMSLSYLSVNWLCTLLVIVFHEMGHAGAASLERLQVQGCGAFLAILVFPGAYVRIEESIHYLPTFSQLRVYSAGIWHNLVLCMACLCSIVSLPILLSPAYIRTTSAFGGHAVIRIVDLSSNLQSALKPGDIVTHINDEPFLSQSLPAPQWAWTTDGDINGYHIGQHGKFQMAMREMQDLVYNAYTHTIAPPSTMGDHNINRARSVGVGYGVCFNNINSDNVINRDNTENDCCGGIFSVDMLESQSSGTCFTSISWRGIYCIYCTLYTVNCI
jgi:hypothetical protein